MMTSFLQSPVYKVIHGLFHPRSETLDEAFRERTIRFFVIIALIFFSFMLIINHEKLATEQFLWYGIIYSIAFAVMLALHLRRIRLASRLMILALLLIPLDSSVAFWSPGTIIFSLLFTFLFQMILKDRRDIIIAVGLNLLLYTIITLIKPNGSPFSSIDYFSNPFLALITMFIAHFLIIGVAHYIRRDQFQRDQMEILLERQRADILRQFIGHVSHDIRTPITKLANKLYILERKPETALKTIDEMRQYLGEFDMMLSTMLEMLSLDEVDGLEMDLLDFDGVILTAIGLYQEEAAKKNVNIDYVNELESQDFWGNNIHLLRAITNILQNAVNFSPEGTSIQVKSYRQDKYIVLEIADKGTGIPAEQLPFVFDRFYRGDEARNHQTGFNGLGLSIAKRIIELHGGIISLKSEVGKGTTMSIQLPLAQ